MFVYNDTMIIIIPLGGIGDRFKIQGYKEPKALINVEGKPIIFWLLDNLNKSHKDIDYIYIIYNKEYEGYDFERIIADRYDNNFKFLKLEKDTEGALETISIGLRNIIHEDDKPVICIDGDNFYTCDIIDKWNGDDIVFTFEDPNIYLKNDKPKFSYVLNHENDNHIIDIKEKELFNNFNQIGCTGSYGFSSFKKLYDVSMMVINDKYKIKNEYYVSSVIKYMINEGIEFKHILIDNKDYFSLGTPEQVKQFEYIFLLDLDGTLVETDNVYINVWDELLRDYEIVVDEVYYNKIIKGKSDKNFLQSIVFNITDEEICEISKKKDILFINNIDKIRLYDDVENFLKQLLNNRTAIVTNCNKNVVLKILNHFNLEKYINLTISSEDCMNNKPDKEPYLKAVSYFNKDIHKCIVFEDSHTGYISAQQAGIETIYVKINDIKSEMLLLNTNFFKNYEEINVKLIIDEKENKNIIRDCFDVPIYNIKDANVKNNGGYICDIIKYKLLSKEKDINIILKLSNNDNSLAYTAKKLDLYTNEKYFYQDIYPHVKDTINIPNCYGVCNNNVKIIIMLEDLNDKSGHFNLNLNKNYDVLINVVDAISKMHMQNYFQDADELPEYLKEVKTIKKCTYYDTLVKERFDKFIETNKQYFSESIKNLFYTIYGKYNDMIDETSLYPLSLCHGDLKSPNIFYENDEIPWFLDFQYINLNKGVSDIIFLLIESVEFDAKLYDHIIEYYYDIIRKNDIEYDFKDYKRDVKNSLSIFPFFVMIWFNTEDIHNLVDKNFPKRFMNKLIKYYEYEFANEM